MIAEDYNSQSISVLFLKLLVVAKKLTIFKSYRQYDHGSHELNLSKQNFLIITDH